MRSVPVYQHVLFDDRSSRTGLECFNVWNGEFEMGRMVEASSVPAGTIVGVWSIKGTDVVGFSVIVPGDDLEELEVVLEFQDLFPSVVPESLGVEEPVLGVRYFFAEVGVDYESVFMSCPGVVSVPLCYGSSIKFSTVPRFRSNR